METNDYKKCIRNAKKTAMRDGYDQLIILDTSDNTYHFTRSFGPNIVGT